MKPDQEYYTNSATSFVNVDGLDWVPVVLKDRQGYEQYVLRVFGLYYIENQ